MWETLKKIDEMFKKHPIPNIWDITLNKKV